MLGRLIVVRVLKVPAKTVIDSNGDIFHSESI